VLLIYANVNQTATDLNFLPLAVLIGLAEELAQCTASKTSNHSLNESKQKPIP
jgi:hypothetical protein